MYFGMIYKPASVPILQTVFQAFFDDGDNVSLMTVHAHQAGLMLINNCDNTVKIIKLLTLQDEHHCLCRLACDLYFKFMSQYGIKLYVD